LQPVVMGPCVRRDDDDIWRHSPPLSIGTGDEWTQACLKSISARVFIGWPPRFAAEGILMALFDEPHIIDCNENRCFERGTTDR
jgi:hypothetical protein